MSQDPNTQTTVLAADFPGFGAGGASLSLDELGKKIGALARSHGGSLEKTLGDSFLLGFDDPDSAVRCAFALLKAFGPRSQDPLASSLPRIGIHRAEAQDLGDDLIGRAPDGATILRSLSQPGTACASREVVSAALASGTFSATPIRLGSNSALPSWLSAFAIAPIEEIADAPPLAAGASDGARHIDHPQLGQESLLEIRSSILEATKATGRRLTVEEARRSYSWYGPEADEVIASLADSGILVRNSREGAAHGEAGGFDAPQAEYGRQGYRHEDLRHVELGKSIEAAIHAIVSEIERSVRESAAAKTDPGAEATRTKELKQRRKGDGKTASKAKNASDMDSYRVELEKTAQKKRRAIVPGVLSFAVFGSALFTLFATQRNDFIWAPILGILWAAGLIKSFIAAVTASRQAKEAQALPPMDSASVKELKGLNARRDSIGKQFVNAVSLPLVLGYIGSVFSPGEAWPMIASAAIIGLFILKFIGHIAKVPSAVRAFFSKAGIEGGRKGLEEARKRRRSNEADPELGNYREIYETARQTASDIEAALGDLDPKSLGEMRPQLDAYLGQVRLLAKTANELDAIIGEIPMAELAKDKADLLKKAETSEPGLKAEYLASAREIENQETSFAGLKEQRELIGLRLESSVNQLTQLKIDLAKARAADSQSALSSGETALADIRAKSQELSRYLDDLKGGQLEALADPFAELEKALAEKEGGKVGT